jgi:hypothetical protein
VICDDVDDRVPVLSLPVLLLRLSRVPTEAVWMRLLLTKHCAGSDHALTQWPMIV